MRRTRVLARLVNHHARLSFRVAYEPPECAPAWFRWASKNDALVGLLPFLLAGSIMAYSRQPPSIWPNMISTVLTSAALVIAIRVLRSFYRRRHREWSGAGACLRCGYDRRGLAPDAKCPECGARPA
jgi:hypothetical protein